ncbi:MAG: hypothetical protein DCC75_05055 [Proteobacteria bacterium]|nr:MAG: hypothetical protein DCC75_05055 [Pseudomonadota bacterium]
MKSDSATNIKNNFSAYLDRVKRGEVILVLEYGRPVAQIMKAEIPAESDLNLAHLEREGLISIPLEPQLDAAKFLSKRKRIRSGVSLLAALCREREESL